ncbi:zinc finger protein 277 isoform X2 [Bemisia tabaci]|uniref:zinc finger protein 277 isoform X2 n=1 Tax=Bemisia tabaci TaxID=7038 RepID=UPI003B27F8C2
MIPPSIYRYLDFWRIQFESSSNALEKFCTKFKVDIEHECDIEKDVECYMLSDHVEEDKCLRQHLHKEKLEAALTQQQFEREDTSFKRCCLFCRFEETGTRAKYLEHLASNHNLQLGRPDNLVYIDDFLDNIEDKIKNLICIFCERTFKDRNVLREHMRKKGHKRPNPRNRFYNQFYIVNYREMGKTWQDETQINCRHQGYRSDSEDEDGHWSDWEEKEESNIVCLFCPRSAHSDVGIFLHMSAYHNFSFKELTHGLHFYEKVKVVNFIRRKVLDTRCIICDSKAESNSALLVHMEEAKHFRLPEKEVWDQPEFFFPILEDDNLLTYLENDDTDDKIKKTENLPGEI